MVTRIKEIITMQLKKLLIVKPILLVNTLVNIRVQCGEYAN